MQRGDFPGSLTKKIESILAAQRIESALARAAACVK